jgi:ABC-2 type transport system permease protein
MVEAGANCIPTTLLFLGAGALALALAPRAGAAVAYGLVGVAFVWDAVGALAGAPRWLLALSPFHDVGLVPAEPFKPVGAAVMLALAALAAAAAVREFGRRDLPGL